MTKKLISIFCLLFVAVVAFAQPGVCYKENIKKGDKSSESKKYDDAIKAYLEAINCLSGQSDPKIKDLIEAANKKINDCNGKKANKGTNEQVAQQTARKKEIIVADSLLVCGKDFLDIKCSHEGIDSHCEVFVNNNNDWDVADVREKDEWLIVGKDVATGKLEIIVAKNNAPEPRKTSFSVIVKGSGDSVKLSVPVTVSQEGTPATLMVNGKRTNFEENILPEGDTIVYYVKTSVKKGFKVDISDQIKSWARIISQDETSFRVAIAENSNKERSGKITVSAANMAVEITLTQNESEKPFLKINDEETLKRTQTVPSEGGRYTFKISTNAKSYELDCDAYTQGTKSSDNFSIEVKPNMGRQSRTAIVRVITKAQTAEIRFEQEGNIVLDSDSAVVVVPIVNNAPPTQIDTSVNDAKPYDDEPIATGFWPWQLHKYHNRNNNYRVGLSIGYVNNMLKYASKGTQWSGNYAWHDEDSRLKGVQLGFHIQRYSSTALGVGIYTGTFFNLYSSSKTIEGKERTFHEYAASLPLHLYLHLPIAYKELSIFVHGGPDFTYFFGNRYSGSTSSLIDENRDVSIEYGTDYFHSAFSLSLSWAIGVRFNHFQLECVSMHGVSKEPIPQATNNYLNQFAFRFSYLFHKND